MDKKSDSKKKNIYNEDTRLPINFTYPGDLKKRNPCALIQVLIHINIVEGNLLYLNSDSLTCSK
jgi:hypothetical protein